MLKYFVILILFISSALSVDFTLNLKGQFEKENLQIVLPLQTDDEGKLVPEQKIDFQDAASKIKSLKIVTANGLKGTLVDERAIVVYYKTSLNVQGLKIRNLYKVATARVYDDERNIEIMFDKDHYQNIVSFLRYNNVTNETIKDLDNLYGSWQEVHKENNVQSEIKEIQTKEITEIN
jgi:hypothetical protein